VILFPEFFARKELATKYFFPSRLLTNTTETSYCKEEFHSLSLSVSSTHFRLRMSSPSFGTAMTSAANFGGALSLLLAPHTFTQHKGSSGRVVVIGGSEDYSGAPYLAAMSALRVGCDLATIICPKAAALAIKAYSPDIIVRGLLDDDHDGDNFRAILATMKTSHAVVVGPGMGVSLPSMLLCRRIVTHLRDDPAYAHIPVVLDACAIKAISMGDATCGADASPLLLGANPALCRSSSGAYKQPVARPAPFVLTPNANELKYLFRSALNADVVAHEDMVSSFSTATLHEQLLLISRAYSATVVLKGSVDIVAHDNVLYACTPPPLASADSLSQDVDGRSAVSPVLPWTRGAPRRAAGQGDVFCGAVCALMAFRHVAIHRAHLKDFDGDAVFSVADTVAAASAIVKRAAFMTFREEGFSTFLASDLLGKLAHAREAFSRELCDRASECDTASED
jgi:hydroxyethylthiazole kinase-like uncharacterized protein yjeF